VFSGDERLGPPLRLPLPRRTTLLRGAAVAGLLCLAAGALLVERPQPARPPAPPAVVTAPPGTVGLPLRIGDSGVAAVVRPGMRVDVLGAIRDGPAQVLASDVLVLRSSGGSTPEDGALLYLAVTREQAAKLAGFGIEAHITVTVRAP
jgi:hypothetical protein